MKYYVYHLIDPRNESIFWVGSTKNPQKRLRNHIAGRKHASVKNDNKNKLLIGIFDSGFRPKINIVGCFSDKTEAFKFEKEETNRLISVGVDLKNISVGTSISDRTKEKMSKSNGWAGSIPTPVREALEKRKIKLIDNNSNVYDSIRDAARKLGCQPVMIRKILSGKRKDFYGVTLRRFCS
jgi:hypothetical protein